jgi:Sodium:sulfate symporter transmembrane region
VVRYDSGRSLVYTENSVLWKKRSAPHYQKMGSSSPRCSFRYRQAIYGASYVSQMRWWRISFALSLAHLLLWLGIGFGWWKLLGL